MTEPLKNVYNEAYIKQLAYEVSLHSPNFSIELFVDAVFCQDWKSYELKQRMRHIALCLNQFLPNNYIESIKILTKTAPKFSGMEAMYFQYFVELFGLDDWDSSLKALECFTKYGSSEFAIRQFILRDQKRAMQQMILWAKSSNLHLRRLASEGCRSRLPWAISLPFFKNNPAEVMKVLDILKNDDEKYVQKSVANNLNDISKDNPEVVIQFIKENINKTQNTNWILKHSARTLLKQSNQEVMELFGYLKKDDLIVDKFLYSKKVSTKNSLEFSFYLKSNKPLGKLRVEYKLYFLRQNEKYNAKVFQIFQGDIKEKIKAFKKSYSFKPINTRKYYKGMQKLELLINGICYKEVEFILE